MNLLHTIYMATCKSRNVYKYEDLYVGLSEIRVLEHLDFPSLIIIYGYQWYWGPSWPIPNFWTHQVSMVNVTNI
jgi:hypothetical protein